MSHGASLKNLRDAEQDPWLGVPGFRRVCFSVVDIILALREMHELAEILVEAASVTLARTASEIAEPNRSENNVGEAD